MAEELKIRIRKYQTIEKQLLKKGAKFLEETNVVDTYFWQPKREVLKITEDDKGNFLVALQSKNGKFEIIKYEPIEEVGRKKQELTAKFGIKRILQKKRRFFKFQKYSININLIKSLGEFLIVEGEKLAPEIITKKLEIKNPEFVTASFDELKTATKQ